MSFLLEATKYNFKAGSEDRLTQIIVASFNTSARFRKVFFRFLGIPYNPKSRAKSQFHQGNSRPDICISTGADFQLPLVIVESKTETSSRKQQLKHHRRGSAKHYALILKYREHAKHKDDWHVCYWDELGSLLTKDLLSSEPKVSFDSMLFQDLVKFFEEYGFMKNSVITRDQLRTSAQFLESVRFSRKPTGSLQGLTDLNKIVEAMELTLEILRVDAPLARALRGSNSFRATTSLSHTYSWGDIDKSDEAALRASKSLKSLKGREQKFLRAEINELHESRLHRSHTVAVEKSISLKRKRKNGIQSLMLNAELISDSPPILILRVAIVDDDNNILDCGDDIRSNGIPKSGLTSQQLAAIASKRWCNFLGKKTIRWKSAG